MCLGMRAIGADLELHVYAHIVILPERARQRSVLSVNFAKGGKEEPLSGF